MGIADLYSKRLRRQEKTAPDLYQYDKIPQKLRVQIAHIWRDSIGVVHPYGDPRIAPRWQYIHNAMAREQGVFLLEDNGNFDVRCVNWFLSTKDENALDMIEMGFRLLDLAWRNERGVTNPDGSNLISVDSAIDELNGRFLEHCVGLQFANSQLIRIDNQFIHSEIVKPALSLLASAPFRVANDEFLLAHRHYRDHKYKDAIVAAQRSFESCLKAICSKKKWEYAAGDRVSELMKLVRTNGLFPAYLDSGLDTYVAMVKTGLPGVRNNAGGHGQEPNAPPVPEYIAAYALHLTAANIVLAVEAAERGQK